MRSRVLSALKHATLGVGESIATIRKARPAYAKALHLIKRCEEFVAHELQGLGHGGAQLYGDHQPFPGGIAFCRVSKDPQNYISYFAEEQGSWRLYVAPVELRDGREIINNDLAQRVADAEAGLVLCCAAWVAWQAALVLEEVAARLERYAPTRRASHQ